MVRWVRSVTALLACGVAGAVAAPSASAASVYSYANGCYALRDVTRVATSSASPGYSATAGTAGRDAVSHAGDRARALPALGPDGRMPATAPLNLVASTSTPGPAADWRLEDVAGRLRLTSVSTGRQLGVGAAGRLTQVGTGPARWASWRRRVARSSPRWR